MAVAYPDGLEQSWGDNREPTPVRPNPDADVHIPDQLTTELTGKYKLDAHHVFLTGLTNGANLALRLAAQSPGTYAGVAAISGQLPVRPAPLVPAGPIPALLIYGTDDPVVPYDGLPNPPAVGDFSEPPIATMSAPQTAQAFADAAKLPPAKPELLPDTAPPDGTTVERTTWSAPGQRARVLFYSIRGGGHNWPGSCTGNNPSSTGACSQELSATDALLDFFTGLT
jgi:polyhydroxybutyrate depolymerase